MDDLINARYDATEYQLKTREFGADLINIKTTLYIRRGPAMMKR